jgi:hypothetical protein
MAEGRKTGGRAPGTPNKATSDARQAIASFVDGNAHRLTEWLDQVAAGTPKLDEEGNPTGEYAIPPNPAKAFDMFQSVVEYHIPKLARTENTGSIDLNGSVDVHLNAFGDLLNNVLLGRQRDASSGK